MKTHPDNERQRVATDKAYATMEKKLTFEEMNAIEDATCMDLEIHFQVGYAAGLADGLATGQALESAEGAHPTKSEAPSVEA